VSCARPNLDAIFDALANRHRRHIVARLARTSMTTPSIAREFGFTKQALSRHLSVLETAGLVRRQRDGRIDRLDIVPARLDAVRSWIDEIKAGWNASLDRLEEVLRDP
jgi:DNA-binding transcriptional ArsR family regulator